MTTQTKSKVTKSSNKLMPAVSYTPSAEDMKYRAQDALRTLTRADEIRRDKALMSHVKKHARQEMKSMEKVCSPRKK